VIPKAVQEHSTNSGRHSFANSWPASGLSPLAIAAIVNETKSSKAFRSSYISSAASYCRIALEAISTVFARPFSSFRCSKDRSLPCCEWRGCGTSPSSTSAAKGRQRDGLRSGRIAIYVVRDQLEHVIRRHSGNSRSIGNCSDVRDDIHCFKPSRTAVATRFASASLMKWQPSMRSNVNIGGAIKGSDRAREL